MSFVRNMINRRLISFTPRFSEVLIPAVALLTVFNGFALEAVKTAAPFLVARCHLAEARCE